jgi:hypothetical protein
VHFGAEWFSFTNHRLLAAVVGFATKSIVQDIDFSYLGLVLFMVVLFLLAIMFMGLFAWLHASL